MMLGLCLVLANGIFPLSCKMIFLNIFSDCMHTCELMLNLLKSVCNFFSKYFTWLIITSTMEKISCVRRLELYMCALILNL